MKSFTGDAGCQWTYDESKPLGQPGGFERAIARTLRERAAADEHLVIPIDTADDGETAFIVLPLAAGSLCDHLAAGGLDESEALLILRQCAEGLAALHQSAVIHRDLKPANVLDFGGTYKLTDFGISRDDSLGTQAPTFKGWGTLAYMAPELWSGQSPTYETDLYAFGCLAVEVLTGQPPFPGPTDVDYQAQHCGEQFVMSDGVSPGLERILMRLLSKMPEARYQNARQLLSALDRIALPLSAAQESLVEASAIHGREIATAEAAVVREREIMAQHHRNVKRARIDLRELLEDAQQLIQAALPSMEITRLTAYSTKLADHNVSLDVELWPSDHPPDSGGSDSLVIAGSVSGSNRRGTERILANLVNEERDGSYCWMLYRFECAPGLQHGSYRFGPDHKPHGFNLRDFLDQRKYMLSTVIHVWRLDKQELTAARIVQLVDEALRLP